MSEVAVRITCGRDALVHLKYMNRSPRDFFIRQHAEHHPRSVTSAYSDKKEAALLASRSRVLSNTGRRPRCYTFCIPKHFQLHENPFFLVAEFVTGFGRGVFHAYGMAARSRCIAAAIPSLSPKIAVPATRTFAPAATASEAVFASMP